MVATGADFNAAEELKELGNIRRFLEAAAVLMHVDQKTLYDLQLAVTELITNTIIHGYKGRPGRLQIHLRREADTIIVRLLDQAPPFDPNTVPSPDLTRPFEQRSPGGMGIFLARQTVDEIKHHITPDGGNELVLVKSSIT